MTSFPTKLTARVNVLSVELQSVNACEESARKTLKSATLAWGDSFGRVSFGIGSFTGGYPFGFPSLRFRANDAAEELSIGSTTNPL